jgi:hypothetical protein
MGYFSKLLLPILGLLLLGSIPACTGLDREEEYLGDGSLYFEYRIWGDEESGEMTIKLQYRLGGPAGQTYMFEDPARVQFDSEVLKPDSSKMNGFYYETTRPVQALAGTHSISYTDAKGAKSVQEFEFFPFDLESTIPPVVNRGDLEFVIKGLADNSQLKLMMLDTASFSEGIVRTDTIKGGKLLIMKRDLGLLRNGPVYLELFTEKERIVREGNKRIGRISVAYGVKREFLLAD